MEISFKHSKYRDILPKGFTVKDYATVTSTNDIVKNAARAGAEEGFTVTARCQTAGRGRMGRSFFSPDGTGLYISILLRPTIHPKDALMITTAAAVATARALEAAGSRNIGIKWVNDLLINGKKIAGILTESSLSMGADSLDFAVLGIGINLLSPSNGFPEEIKDIAGAVFDNARTVSDGDTYSIIQNIAGEFFSIYKALPDKAFMNEYKDRSTLLGKAVTVSRGTERIEGIAIDIDAEGRLIVKDSDGATLTFSSGEARVRAI